MDNGLVIDGRYRVERTVGGGTFSDVFVVTGPAPSGREGGKRSALKLLKKGIGGETNPESVADFKNEFSILKNLNHPNIARILDFGYDPALKQYYYTSELVEGQNLFEATAGRPVDWVLGLLVEVLRAFNYLHSYHVYHFDVKSANILVTKGEDQIKVIDFGLASIDPKGKMIGTPSYMAPEIIAKEKPDGRADLYSLGVLFYYSLTRRNPFRGKGVAETLKNQQTLVAPPASSLRPEIPPFFDKILIGLLEKNPANRYQRADEVLREINFYSQKKFPMETRETLLSYLPEEGRLIGRKKEIELFEKCFQRVFSPLSREDLLFILLTGPQGVGKSRLLKEYKFFSQLHGVPVESASVLEPHSLASWLSRLRQHVTAGHATVFLIDDLLSWTENSAEYQSFHATLLRLTLTPSGERVPLLFVGAMTDLDLLPPSLREAFPQDLTAVQSIGPFSPEELREYVTSLTGLPSPPEGLLSGLIARTEGNPLLVTEILRSLIEEGVLFDPTGRWKETTFEDIGIDFSKARVGRVLEEILLARYEKLAPPLREALEALAVAGGPLRFHEISRLVGSSDPAPLLEELMRREIIGREEPRGGFRLKNAILADLICQKIPATRRQTLHDRAAALFSPDSDRRLFHEIRGSDIGKALTLCREAGKRLLQEAHGMEAAALFRFALGLPGERSADQEIDLYLKLGEACLIGLDYPEALQALGHVEEVVSNLKEKVENVHGQVDALLRIGAVYLKMGELEKSRNSLAAARGLLGFIQGDRVRELVAENLQGTILMQEGRLEEARRLFERTRHLWEKELSPTERKKVTNNDLGMVCLASQEYPQALRQFTADLGFFKTLGDRLLLVRTHYNLGQTYLGLKEFSPAAEHYQTAAEISQKLRNTEFLLRSYNGLGNVFNLMGKPEEAVRYYERGLDLCERTGDLRSHAAILVNIGIIEGSLGHFDKARRRLDPAISILRSMKTRLAIDWQVLVRALLEEGDIARKEKRWREAERILREALLFSEENEGGRPLRFWILHNLSGLYLEKGEAEEADRLLPEMRRFAQTPDEISEIAVLTEDVNRSMGRTGVRKGYKEGEVKMKNAYAYILEINKFINAEADLPFVLKTVLNYALELSQAEAGVILLLNAEGELHVSASRNIEAEDGIREVSQTIARKVIETGELVRMEDAAVEEEFRSEGSVARLGLRSVLCLPIRSKRKTIGVIYLDNRLLPNAFEHADLEALLAFAEQAGIAIENARLLEGYEEKKRELEGKVDEISSQLEHFQSLARISQRGLETKYDYTSLVGRSKPLLEIFRLLDKVTDTDLFVFIHGESGTGKELIARALHVNSGRSKHRFVAVNCGAVPATLIESEFFGYKAGAFTGATRDKRGLFEEASGGTLFLDEVTELDPTLQAKLLRVVQEGEFFRLGDSEPRKTDVRILSASNRDIQALVGEGKFREDLYYRLCQIRIDLPPLRGRREDIPLLVSRFVREEAGKPMKVSSRLMKAFMEYDWPGNVRELENLIKVAVALSEGGVIDTRAIPSNYGIARLLSVGGPRAGRSVSGREPIPPQPSTPLIDSKNRYDPEKGWYDYERLMIAKAYRASGFNAQEAARRLGLAPATLYKKVKEIGLGREAHPLYQDPFQYDPQKKLKDYLRPVFQAALAHCGNKPYAAISRLKVSQGYFYKVMKEK